MARDDYEPSPDLRQSIQALQRMNEQMALPNGALQEAVRRLGEQLAAANAPLQEAMRRMNEQTANPRALESGSRAATVRSRPAVEQQDSSSGRAAHETSTDQPAQIHGTDDVQKDTGRNPDSGYDQ